MTVPRLESGDPGFGKDAGKRLVRIAAALLLLAGIVTSSLVREIVSGLWIAANVILFLFLLGWGLCHPRAVSPGFRVARSWAFWIGLIGTLIGFSFLETFLGEVMGFKLPGGVMLFGSILFFVLLIPLLLLQGLVGAAAAAFFGPGEDRAARARLGPGAWWLVTFPALLLIGFLPDGHGWTPLSVGLLLGQPVLTALLCRALSRRGLDLPRLAHLFLGFLSKRLIWRRMREGRRAWVDFRGPALGLGAAVLALLVGATEALVPLQSVAMVSLIRFRNEPLLNGISLYQVFNEPARTARKRIVLLRMDPDTRRKALTTSSEAALQAELVRRAQAWKPALLVLPAPVLEEGTVELRIAEFPRPRQEQVERSLRDFDKLQALVRSARNVVVGLPAGPHAFPRESWGREWERQELHARLEQLAKVAPAGQAGLAFLGAARLPAIPTRWNGRPPLPFVVAAAFQRQKPVVEHLRGQRAVRVGQKVIPEVAPDRLLVDFAGSAPGRDFQTVAWSAAMAGEPVYAPEGIADGMWMESHRGKWLPTADFFKDKIVFVESVAEPLRETPLGVMPQSEILANATATLLSEYQLRAPGPVVGGLWVLALGAFMGFLCARRRPLDGLWRVLGMLFLVFLVTTTEFIFWGVWVEPVVPALAVLGGFILASQFTFELERGERDRNRSLLQRFVAPQLVDEMLDDPDFELGLGGHRRQVCVVFADVRNFTRFAERSTPEQVIDITNRYLSAMTDALHAYGGILDKYTGDGLMAFFQEGRTLEHAPALQPGTGPPLLPVIAVQAAIAMQQAVARVSWELAHEGREPLHVGIGMHYGEAVVGFVGSANRLDYTALGHTVVVSQRLQTLAGGGEVIISEALFQAVSGRFPVEPGDPVQVKGLSEPVRPYRVAALGQPSHGGTEITERSPK